jgi:hypothetical protein
MKKTILILFLGMVSAASSFAQFEVGLRLGMSSQNVSTDQLTLQSTTLNELRLSLGNASYGYHFGLFTQFKLGAFTIGPEVILNSNSYEYKLEEFNEEGGLSKIITDSYQYLDIPILFGVKLGPLRAYAGPEVHYFVNSYSALAKENGFAEQIDKLNYGAIGGAGLNVGKIRLDVRYELNLSSFDDNIVFNNQGIDFNSNNSRLIFSLGYKLN